MRRLVTVLVAVVLAPGCGESRLPKLPTNPSENTALTVSSVAPAVGWPLYSTVVLGTGFRPGVRVTFGGIDAQVASVENGRIVTNPPWRDPGTVDVVVTNPEGSSVTLPGGFTYRTATLELTKSDVGPGEPLGVTWSGPQDPSDFLPPDIVGVYAVDNPHPNSWLWSTPTYVGEWTSSQFNAPTSPGTYEVRYYMLSAYLLAKVPLMVR